PHDAFGAVFATLAEELRARWPDVAIERMSVDLLVDEGGAAAAVDATARAGADVAIIGLLDQGVTQSSVRFAVELERRGIATSLVCHGSGGRLAAAMAELLAPGLPATVLRVVKSASYERVRSATAAIAAPVLEGLTSDTKPAHAPAPDRPG